MCVCVGSTCGTHTHIYICACVYILHTHIWLYLPYKHSSALEIIQNFCDPLFIQTMIAQVSFILTSISFAFPFPL